MSAALEEILDGTAGCAIEVEGWTVETHSYVSSMLDPGSYVAVKDPEGFERGVFLAYTETTGVTVDERRAFLASLVLALEYDPSRVDDMACGGEEG